MLDLHFVFLQGMPSAFFSNIAKELHSLGCKTTGINLCIGDAIFWRGDNTVNFRGSLSDWPAFITDYFKSQQVTDLVLLGEQRSYHKPAVEVAKSLGIRVTVTDFGYLRPDWITLERDGMSGDSRFPKQLDEISKLASAVSAVDTSKRYEDSALHMSIGDLVFSFSNVFLGWLYPNYRRSDKRPHPLIYFPAMGWRLLYAKFLASREQQRLQALIAAKAQYFVFPLQLEHDFQIVAYSAFASLEDAISMVLESFAQHAQPSARLLFKVHPWDPGLKNWKKIIRRWTEKFGITERVDYFEGGSLDDMIKSAVGMVTVNSTSGIRALQLGCPVVTLGQAVYNIGGLTFIGELDNFWTNTIPPQAELVNAFLNVMAATIQVRGVFFQEPGMTAAVNEVVQRLYNNTVGCTLN